MNRSILSVVILFTTVIVTAQPVITSSFNPITGDHTKYHPTGSFAEAGNSGSNVLWDFSGLNIIYNPIMGTYHHPNQTMYGSSFPTADIAYEQAFVTGTYHYYNTSSASMEKLGYANAQITAIYDNPQEIITYPFNFGDDLSNNYSCTATVGSFTFTLSGSYSIDADAYGTLSLPSGDYPTLRLAIHNDYTEEYDDGSSTLTYRYDIYEWWWVDGVNKNPLMKTKIEYQYNAGLPFDTIKMVTVSDDFSDIEHNTGNTRQIKLSPNPVTNNLSIDFSIISEEIIECNIYDMTGQLVLSESAEKYCAGKHSKIIHCASLDRGSYLAAVNIGGNQQTMKFIKIE